MYSGDWAMLGFFIMAVVGFIVGIVMLCLSADSSSWITYDQGGKHCITLYQSDNHVFSPDKTYSQNWCSK